MNGPRPEGGEPLERAEQPEGRAGTSSTTKDSPGCRPFDAADWSRLVSRVALDPAARLVTGALLDRADRHGRVQARLADLAACTCLSVVLVADVLADFAVRRLLGRDGDRLVLTLPGVER